MQPQIQLQNVTKNFSRKLQVLAPLNLEIPAQQFVSVLGPSGCGKSTLLRLISGLELPSDGQVILAPNAKLSYVFQEPLLLPWKTVLDNTTLPLELQGVPLLERREKARTLLSLVGLSEFVDFYPAQLSGGMKMRVSIARALITEPDILLMDEPFGSLDEITRKDLDAKLLEIWKAKGLTILFVTHSISEALSLSQRLLVFSKRPSQLTLDTPNNPLRSTELYSEILERIR